MDAGDNPRSVDVCDSTTDVGAVADSLVDPPGLHLAVTDVVEAVTPDLQLTVGVAMVDLYCAYPLGVVTGVLPACFCVNADLRVEAPVPRSSVARTHRVMGAGRSSRSEQRGCHQEDGRDSRPEARRDLRRALRNAMVGTSICRDSYTATFAARTQQY